jgi:transposase
VYDETMAINDLCQFIFPLKPKEKIYKTDHMLANYGHTFVPSPPYMCDLNPVELVWAKM